MRGKMAKWMVSIAEDGSIERGSYDDYLDRRGIVRTWEQIQAIYGLE